MDPSKWTEASISRAVTYGLFKRAVLVVPQCKWTGHECDLLVIEPGLRIIDIEVKISRADLKQDLAKDKWWHHRPWSRRHEAAQPRQWPDKVWKHYYALPKAIWEDKLYVSIPPNSGVLLLESSKAGAITINCIRRAKPDGKAKPITHVDAIDLARLCSLRLWSALQPSPGASAT